MPQVTKKGALQVSQAFDRLASLFQTEYETLGVSEKVATDYAFRLDQVSDLIEKNAGLSQSASSLSRKALGGPNDFPPEVVGELEDGALDHDSDEPYVRDNFTQQENSELLDKQQTGQLAHADMLPEQDMLGKLASAVRTMDVILQGLQAEQAASRR